MMNRNKTRSALLLICVLGVTIACSAQAAPSQDQAPPAHDQAGNAGHAYSGMYSFLKDGEFVQITVEDEGRVTGFISRYGSGESDKGAFLDQFFKTGKLEGNNLSFSTATVHGVSFDFKGSVGRGEGKNPGEESYFVIKGTLTENSSDVNNKVTSHSREVVFKSFPQNSVPPAATRK
ncbi:MAG TPA: hypothetical protein VFA67_07565 [Candidatus Sulfotelmatobacter sp.]|nr:hypothetical protein [Candidatus Sulfotelmatobacter sp.]